jgi:hypothetical protein
MHTLRRDIIFGLGMSALALVLAMAWGSPFIGFNPAHAQDHAQPQRQELQLRPKGQAQNEHAKPKPHPGILSRLSTR